MKKYSILLMILSLSATSYAEDICYQQPQLETSWQSGFPPIPTIRRVFPIENISGQTLNNVEIKYGIKDFAMSFNKDIGIDNTTYTNANDYESSNHRDKAENSSGFSANFGTNFNIFDKGINYHLENMSTGETNKVWTSQFIMSDVMSNFLSTKKFFATYTKNGVSYNVVLNKCGSHTDGAFDAWDPSRENGLSTTKPQDDRNISTEIVNKPFKLSFASLNKDATEYEHKNNDGAAFIYISIYPNNSNNKISNTIKINANLWHINGNDPLLADFNVSHASKDAVVGFKFCATYENNDTYSNAKTYMIYTKSKCSASTDIKACDATTSGTPTWHMCHSTDHLAIRPDHFVLSSSNADFADKLHAGHEYNLTVTAYDGNSDATQDYNQTSDDINTTNNIKWLNTNPKKRNGDGATLPSSANPTFQDFNMTDGVSSVDSTKGEVAQLSYDDIGFVTLEVNDTKWAEVDEDDTPANCDGRYICGDKNVTFIPDHFAITNIEVNNSSDGKFTYLNDCNDSNNSTFKDMSARVGVKIIAQNEKNTTTKNFTSGDGFYEQELNVTFDVSDTTHGDANKTKIANTLLGFGTNGDDNGTKTISVDESNLSKALRFNFHREVNKTINPFEINGSNVTLDVNTTYSNTTIVGNKNSNTQLDGNATFVYGQAHAGTQRYQVPDDADYTAHIYYEVYCYGNECDTNLIKPINPTLKHLDDIRWYKNMEHNVSRDGNVTAVFEKDANEVNSTTPTNSVPTDTNLTYSGSLGYPYTTTMEINATNWLIYNESNANATSNPFQVEFDKANIGWGGKHETNTSTTAPKHAKTSRRDMW